MASRAGRVGFVGLGIMGRPMVRNLLRAGYAVTVHTRTPETATEAIAAGAQWAASPSQAASSVRYLITMLPDSPEVEAVMLGSDGVRSGITGGSIVIDMSTIDPDVSRRVAMAMAAIGVSTLDAPVSGGESGAIAGSLSIMVGGPQAAFDAARPLLDTLGTTVVRVGEAGAGQIAKAANQLIVGATIEAVAEALVLAARAGADPHIVHEVLQGGFAASRILDVHGARMLAGDYRPGFRARLHQKDARIVQTLARSIAMELPGFTPVAARFDELVAAGGGELDHAALATLLGTGSDLQPPAPEGR